MSRCFKADDQPGFYIANGPVSSEEILKMASTLLNRRFARGRAIGAPEEAKSFVAMKLGHLEHEVFACCFSTTGTGCWVSSSCFGAPSTGRVCIRARS